MRAGGEGDNTKGAPDGDPQDGRLVSWKPKVEGLVGRAVGLGGARRFGVGSGRSLGSGRSCGDRVARGCAGERRETATLEDR